MILFVKIDISNLLFPRLSCNCFEFEPFEPYGKQLNIITIITLAADPGH